MTRMVALKYWLLAGFIAIGASLHHTPAQAGTEKLIVVGGCFWCVESDFESVDGVTNVLSGSIGGTAAQPTHRA